MDLQFFTETLQLCSGGGRGGHLVVVVMRRWRRKKINPVAPQHLQLVVQLVHPGHGQEKLLLLLQEQSVQLFHLLHWNTHTHTSQ